MIDGDVLGMQILRAIKLAICLGFISLFAWGAERIFGLAPKSDMNAFQKAAHDGNPLPLALIYVGVLYLISVILSHFQ